MNKVKRFRKEDIEFHALGMGYRVVPAVNVKVYKSTDSVQLPIQTGGTADPILDAEGNVTGYGPIVWHYTDEDFTREWIDAKLEEDTADAYFNMACELGWELLQDRAEEIFGPGVKVYSEGRSGGWAYVDGIDDDVDSWDATMVTKWGRFAREARAIADDVPYQMVMSLYLNEWEWEREQRETRAADDADSAAEYAAEQAMLS